MKRKYIYVVAIIGLYFFQSCGPAHNSVPKVNSNASNYFIVEDKISSTPRYINGTDLFFIYKENYNDQDTQLDYKIYDQKRVVVQSSLSVPITIKYGLNKLQLPLTGLLSNTGIYVLEITDEKNQKKFITFLKSV